MTDQDHGPEFVRGSTQQVIDFFQDCCRSGRKVNCGLGNVEAIDHYITKTTTIVSNREKALAELENELAVIGTRVQMLGGTISANNVGREQDLLASTHGSKPATLVRILPDIQENGKQAIVFSYWHDTLRLVQRTLQRCNLPSAFCDGLNMSRALVDFTSANASFLLLSAQAKASGANLQCATHVILLDPAGSSAEHGAALEQQAIERAVRMGQERPVTVTRFSVTATVEEVLFDRMDFAALESHQMSNDASYVIEGAHKVLSHKQQSSVDKNAEEVQLTESVSAAERVKREFVHAKEKGIVVELLDSDDEVETEKQTLCAVPNERSVPVGPEAVKIEPTSTNNNKRAACEINGDSESASSPKRGRDNENESVAETPSDRNESKVDDKCVSTAESETKTFSPPASQEPEVDSELGNESGIVTTDVRRSPSSTSGEERSDEEYPGMLQVKLLLERCQLYEYEVKFQEKGYDCLDWLYEVASDSKVLEKIASDVGFKPGHEICFQHMLTKEAGERELTFHVSSFVDV